MPIGQRIESVIIDADQVLFDWAHAFIAWAGSAGLNPVGAEHGPTQWDLTVHFPHLTREDLDRVILAFNTSPAFAELPLVAGADHAMAMLRDELPRDVRLASITAPGDDPRTVSMRRAALGRLGITDTLILPARVSKASAFQVYGHCAAVDDNPAHIDEARATGSVPIVFDCVYNRNVENAFRIRDWREDWKLIAWIAWESRRAESPFNEPVRLACRAAA